MGDEEGMEEYIAELRMQLEEQESKLEMAGEIGQTLLAKNEQLEDDLEEEKELRKLQAEENTSLQEQLAEAVRLIHAFQEREDELKGNERGDVQAIEELQHQIDELHSDASVHKDELTRARAEFDRKESRFEAQEQTWLARIAELEEQLENEIQKVFELVESQQSQRQQTRGRRRSISMGKQIVSPDGELLEEDDDDDVDTAAQHVEIEVDEEVAQEVERLQRELEKWRNQHLASEHARNQEAEVRREAVADKRKLEIRTRNAEEAAEIAEERAATAAEESANLYKQVESLKRQISAQHTKYTQLEVEMDTMKRMTKLQSEDDGMMSLLDELTTEDNSAWQEEKNMLERQLEDIHQKWRDSIKERDSYRQDLEAATKREHERQQLQRDFEALQTKSQTDSEKVMTLGRENERLQKELTDASAAADQMRSTQAVKNKEMLDFQEQLRHAQMESQTHLTRLQAVQTELDETRSGMLDKESDLIGLRKRLRELQESLASKDEENKKLGLVRDENTKHKQEKEQLKIRVAELQQLLESQTRQKEMLQKQNEEHQSMGSADETRLMEQINELMEQLSVQSATAAREQEEMRQRHEKQLQELQEQLDQKKDQLSADDTEKVAQLEHQLEQAQAENEAIGSTFKEFQAILAQQKSELSRFMADVTKAEEEKRRAQQERAEESGKLRAMELRSRKAEDSVHAIKEEMATYMVKFKRLQTQVVAAQELDDQVQILTMQKEALMDRTRELETKTKTLTSMYNKLEERAEGQESDLLAAQKKHIAESQIVAKLRKELLVQKAQLSLGGTGNWSQGGKTMPKPQKEHKQRKENADIRAELASLGTKRVAAEVPAGKRERRLSKIAVESAALKEMQMAEAAIDENTEEEDSGTDVMFEHFHLTAQAVLVNNPLLAEAGFEIVDLYKKVNNDDVPFHHWHSWLMSQLADGAVAQSKRTSYTQKRLSSRDSEDDTQLLLHGCSFIQYTKGKLGRVQKKAVSVRVTDGFGTIQVTPLNERASAVIPISFPLSKIARVRTGRDASPLFSKVDSTAEALLFSVLSEDGKSVCLDLQAQNVSIRTRWVNVLQHLIDSHEQRQLEAKQAATASPYRVIAPASVRTEFAVLSERVMVLRPGDVILVTHTAVVTENDIKPDEDDGAGIGGKVDMGHIPVGTQRAKFESGGGACWTSVVSGSGTRLLVEDKTAKVGTSAGQNGAATRSFNRHRSMDSFFEPRGRDTIRSQGSFDSLSQIAESNRPSKASSRSSGSRPRRGSVNSQGSQRSNSSRSSKSSSRTSASSRSRQSSKLKKLAPL
eukprot:SAG31_NODE_798_length_12027_cov_8.190057_1_plen_1297_part_00